MIAIFISIVSFFLLLANAALYKAASSAFGIADAGHGLAFGLSLGILSASFIIATILGNKFYNRFTRVYYTVSAVWLGFFCYLFFASAVYGIAALFPFSIEILHTVGIVGFGIALLGGLYGIFHSRNIVVKDVRVELPSLPTVWRGRSAVWVSDLHLGQLHGPAFAKKVADGINALSPDIVFIGGDLFDGTSAPDLAELIAPLRGLSPALGTYYVTGNHEEFEKGDPFTAAVKAAGIRVLEGESVDIDGLKIFGIGHAHGANKEKLRGFLSNLSLGPHTPSILLKHEPRDLDIAEKAGISLQISGHTHRAQMWPLGYIARWVYKGFEYGLKPHGTMQVYTSSGVGTWGPPQRVGTDSEIVRITF